MNKMELLEIKATVNDAVRRLEAAEARERRWSELATQHKEAEIAAERGRIKWADEAAETERQRRELILVEKAAWEKFAEAAGAIVSAAAAVEHAAGRFSAG